MKKLFQPFAIISKQILTTTIILQIMTALLLWHFTSNGLIPKPGKVAEAFTHLLTTKTLLDNILVSLALTVQAMLYSIIITLAFAYLSVIPFFRSMAQFIVKCRYPHFSRAHLRFYPANQRWQHLKTLVINLWHCTIFCHFFSICYSTHQPAGI